jgi:hypothetical protein
VLTHRQLHESDLQEWGRFRVVAQGAEVRHVDEVGDGRKVALFHLVREDMLVVGKDKVFVDVRPTEAEVRRFLKKLRERLQLHRPIAKRLGLFLEGNDALLESAGERFSI